MPNGNPDKYQLLDAKLAAKKLGSLEDYVLNRRGDRASWSDIALEIRDDTRTRVSDETLRRWFTDRDTYPASPP